MVQVGWGGPVYLSSLPTWTAFVPWTLICGVSVQRHTRGWGWGAESGREAKQRLSLGLRSWGGLMGMAGIRR